MPTLPVVSQLPGAGISAVIVDSCHQVIDQIAASLPITPYCRSLRSPQMPQNEPIEVKTRWQQRQDLATQWLHLDGDAFREQRHCAACQPHNEVLIIECAYCGDGPLVTGISTDNQPSQWPPALHTWLRDHGWSTQPELFCAHHH